MRRRSGNDPDAGAPLRLMVLDHSAKLSGAEINLLKVLPYLESVESVVVLGEGGPLGPALVVRGVAVEVVPLDPRAGSLSAQQSRAASLVRGGVAFAAYAWRLRRVVRRYRPDLVYTNSSKAHLYGAVVSLMPGVKLVCHVHDRLTRDTYSAVALRLLRFVFGVVADGVIANSRSTASTLPARASERTVALACPIEVAERPPRTVGAGTRFAVIGRISPWKGQDLAIRAFDRWSQVSGAPGDLTIVGGALFGEDAFADTLSALIADRGLGDRVRLVGPVSPDRIPAVLSDVDVLIHSSVIPEPFGQVVLEGMQAGVVVIAAGAGGPAEVVQDGVDGMLYPMGDEAALVQAMTRAAASPALRSRIGARAAASARRYEVAEVVPRYDVFLQRIAGGRASNRRPTTSSP